MPTRRLLGVIVSLALALPAATAVAGAPTTRSAPVQGWLAERLAGAAPSAAHRVFVHARTTAAAGQAAARAGLGLVERFGAVDVVVADGTTAAVRQLLRDPAVTYVEGDLPVAPLLDRVHRATRNAQAQAEVTGPGFQRLGGQGVSVAVIDTGVDGTHPFFQLPEGGSRVVANLKTVCHNSAVLLVPAVGELDACWAPVPTNDSDTGSAGGHGTHVAGIVAGTRTDVVSTVFGDERHLVGVAPDATVVALSVGATSSIYGSYSALHWLSKHHREPCGAGVPAADCPPVRVVNNSYGPVGGSRFDPLSVVTKLNRSLVAQGVTVVYAAGNDAGDGSGKDLTGQRVQGTNGPGNDPTPGVLMVASYDDDRTGTRDGQVSSFSSRGTRGMPETYPDLSAPGSSVTSSCRQWMPTCADSLDTYDGPGAAPATFATLSGTSMAAPYVAGVVAELLQLDPRLSPAQVEGALEDSAHRYAAGAGYEPDPSNPASPTSFDKGHGLVDVVAAVELVRRGVRPLPPPPAGPGSPGAPSRPAPAPYPLPQGETSCRTAFVDPRGDADDVFTQPDAAPNRPSLDLLSGRWEWDGEYLTAVWVVDDLSSAAATRGLAAGEQFAWYFVPAGFGEYGLVVSLGAGTSYVTGPGTVADENGDLLVSVVDRPGTGNDEVRASFSDEELAALPAPRPSVRSGLVLRTTRVEADHQVALVGLLADDVVTDDCAYAVGAADRRPRGRSY